jgi:hypothetical protein
MIHGGSMLSTTATAAEMQQVKALMTTYVATVLQSNRKKSTPQKKHGEISVSHGDEDVALCSLAE